MVNSWRIKIQRAAKEDLRSGYEFYNAQEFGLENYFYDCLMSIRSRPTLDAIYSLADEVSRMLTTMLKKYGALQKEV